MCCNVLQCVAMCCSVSVCCSEWCNVLLSHGVRQAYALCCNALQYVAMCWNVLQYVSMCCSAWCNVLLSHGASQAYERDLFPQQTIPRYFTITHRDVFLCTDFFFLQFMPFCQAYERDLIPPQTILYRQSLNLSPLTSGEGGFLFLCVNGFLFFIASHSVCHMYRFDISLCRQSLDLKPLPSNFFLLCEWILAFHC